jgi:biopolymer transport protein ExbD
MIRFLLLSLALCSCAQHEKSQAPENSVSMIIYADSVIIYSGKLKKSTPYHKIAIDEVNVKAILAKAKTKASEGLSVLMKLSDDFRGSGFLDHVLDLKKWSIESGVTDIRFVDMDEMDLAVFKLLPVPWSFIDSLARPSSLNLVMPKEEPTDAKPIKEENALTLILMSDQGAWAYTGAHYTSMKLYSTGKLRQLLKEKVKERGDSLIVIIKPAKQASYKATVDILDEMTINHIKHYAIVKLSKEEEDFFNSPNTFEPLQPIQIETPKSISIQDMPNDNAFYIEIRGDQSVWYQPISLKSRMAPQKVNPPITKNLEQIIADYEKAAEGKKINYFIKSDKAGTYLVFDQVINALKTNNIYKYNLITSEQ